MMKQSRPAYTPAYGVYRQPPIKVDRPSPAPNRLLQSPTKRSSLVRRYVK